MLTVRRDPLFGVPGQVVVLTGLAVTVGLGPAGWAAGLACALVTCAALTRGLNLRGVRRLGPADAVTLTRAVLVGGVAALVADSFFRLVPVGVVVGLSIVALVLDAVDGQVARRTGTVSELGARFDMETDAFLIMVLSAYVARSAGAWVLALGAMRYAYVAASWALPWLRLRLPPRYWRKVVAATVGIVLVAAAALPGPAATVALVVALALLVESFGRDVVWQWRARRGRASPPPTWSRAQMSRHK
ncbi:CDP-alcohol phosphatidyltransferase family protein [Luedemannella flava]|uniref:CDP-alcohol phosphatidyltransferase family protein n=1 Tax=Luedemannella flava TaxID=349316 RepID=A0ABN2MN18_9ACTN